ncbi:restriction endonuclease subunit S [Aquabacterium sp. UBA2148]|uniref:restriction endonuclease subunit S n=1 Tax=Aquabacterium sp. UBA2148 TaxID=1946042 RepID=UPI00257B84B9|nr:restriction endonuclease subunit S [Aquabacterium sp. UBA2148]
MSFPRYPAYKESGIDWLGVIPEHWSVMPLARIASGPGSLFIDGDWVESKDLADEGIRYITTGNVGEGKYKEQGSGYISQEKFDELRCTEVLPGDVLISRLNLPIGRACVVPDLGERIITSVDNVITRPDDGYSRTYLAYMLSSAAHFANMEILARGTTMQRISRSALGQVRFAFPSPDEQKAIALFLDRETAKIDALVAEQEQLITLLKEKRQAVISHAVTKGLDPSVPMKDSGVEWLGEVPEHWQMLPLKRVSPAQTVGIVVNPSTYVCEDGLPFIYGGDIADGVVHYEGARRISVELSDSQPKTRLSAGDLVTVRVGAPGVTAVVPPECEGGNCASVMLIRRGNFNSEWLCFLMNSRVVRYQVEVVQYGAAQEQFNIAHATEFVLPVPPFDEQRVIAEELMAEAGRLEELEHEAEAVIRLLQERRSALISAAVTGQIDVRGLAPAQAQAA